MPDSTSASVSLERVALCIEYNGSCFNGWQSQKSPHVNTVQESLEDALSEVANQKIKVHCAGRTDARVHASAQIVHFDHTNPRPEDAWVRGGNSILPGSVSIRWGKQVRSDFHARFSATARRYRYIIYNHSIKPALLHGLVTPYHRLLDAEAMHAAGQKLLGENDFSAFRGAACQSSTPMREVKSLSVYRKDDFVILEIEANAFLLHMVRNIAGVLMEIGEGSKPTAWAEELLMLKDRTLGGVTALPDGLYLVKVSYPAEFGLPQVSQGPHFLI
ncbi:MAG: tRNA pseudouridine(38-40) synthase TruA [Gammaproteobacteria bacterium]|nr:tRNA pseudouridine(38-40) synthase TruA [Gammaproteobacteria bacterium]